MVLIVWCFRAFAADAADTATVYRLNEVVVTGQRMALEAIRLPSSVQTIDSTFIASLSAASVADLIRFSSGVDIRRYGGQAALQSVSLRGLGQDYSLILIDGQRFTTEQISTVDLGILPFTDVERIEIAAGGNSALYGADAVGGVVNIITKRPGPGLTADVSLKAGAFGMTSYALYAAHGWDRFGVNASFTHSTAPNQFPFRYSDGTASMTLERTGADYSLNMVTATATYETDDISHSLSVRSNDAERGQPAPVTGPFQNNLARIHDRDLSVLYRSQWSEHRKWTVDLSAMVRRYQQNYSDPNLQSGGEPLTSYYLNNIASLAPQCTYNMSEDVTAVVGIEAAVASLRSDEVRPAERRQAGAFASASVTFREPLEWTLFPSIRYDTYNDAGGIASPKIGINVAVCHVPELRLRASYGRNFRVPTFNDLYWIVGGNPGLRPEHSVSYDAGVAARTDLLGPVEAEVNYFSIRTTDKIVWQPGPSAVWSPRNLRSVSSDGIEARLRAQLFADALSVTHVHNFTSAKKMSADIPDDATTGKYLPYTPKEHSATVVTGRIAAWSLTVVHSFSGFRYEREDNDPAFVLPSYSTTDLLVGYTVRWNARTVRATVAVDNLFSRSYEIITGYPVPLRNYVASLEFHL